MQPAERCGGVVRAAEPVTPPLAEQQGVEGRVQVVVSLDADSRVTAIHIQTSPSSVLNQAALAAARATTFKTEVRDCRAIAGEFPFSYGRNSATQPPMPEVRAEVSVIYLIKQ